MRKRGRVRGNRRDLVVGKRPADGAHDVAGIVVAPGGSPELQLGRQIGGGLAGQGGIARTQTLTVGAVAGGTGGDGLIRHGQTAGAAARGGMWA